MVATGKDVYVLIAVSWQSYPEYVREGDRVVPHVRDSYTERKKTGRSLRAYTNKKEIKMWEYIVWRARRFD